MPTQPTPTPRSPRRSTGKAATTKSTKPKASRTVAPAEAPLVKHIDPEHRRALIAQAAYFRAEKRNFASGFEVQDWLSAEAEVDSLLTLGVPSADH